MRFKKPFQAVPITLGAHAAKKQRQSDRQKTVRLLGMAAATGAIGGAGSIMFGEANRAVISNVVRPIAARVGIMRARSPRAGDFWTGCDDARAAGTAPIYSTEPGYRSEMDGDDDGIACEPRR